MIKNILVSMVLNLQHIGRKFFKMTKSIKKSADTSQIQIGDILPLSKDIVMTEYAFHKTDEQKQMREWLMTDKFRNDLMITASTYSNMSNDKLNELLRQLSNRVNYKMNRYYRKQPNRRIKMNCFNEYKGKQELMLYGQRRVIQPNTHSHIIAEIPSEFDTKKVIRLMKQIWRENNNRKFQLHTSIKKDKSGKWKNVCYATKGFKSQKDTNKYYVC